MCCDHVVALLFGFVGYESVPWHVAWKQTPALKWGGSGFPPHGYGYEGTLNCLMIWSLDTQGTLEGYPPHPDEEHHQFDLWLLVRPADWPVSTASLHT